MLHIHPTDTFELMRLKLRVANLRQYLDRDLTANEVGAASRVLRDIWRDWAIMEETQS